MARKSKPTFEISQEVLDSAESIKGPGPIATLATEIKAALEADDLPGDEAQDAILAADSFPHALQIAQEYVTFEPGGGE